MWVKTALNLRRLHGIESAGSSESSLDASMISTNDKYKILYELVCFMEYFSPDVIFFLLIFYYDSDSVVIVYSCFYL